MAFVISMDPEDFVQGGLLQDVDVEVVSARWETFDYGGNVQMRAELPIAIHFTLKVDGGEDLHEEFVTAGSSADFIPNPEDNGDTLKQNGTKEHFTKNCNLDLFNTSAVKCGFPKSLLKAGQASVYNGLKFHLVRPVAPKRAGLSVVPQEGKRESTYLAMDKINKLPGGKAAKPAAAPKDAAKDTTMDTGTAPAAAVAGAPDAVKDQVRDGILQVLAEVEGNKLPRMKILAALTKVLPAGPAKSAAVKLVQDNEWMVSIGLTLADGQVSLG